MITDLSDRKIDIDARFVGEEILVYGARVEAGDIVVVIRGPNQDFIVRKKEKVWGMWMNTSWVKFKNVPQYYAVSASRDLESIDSPIIKERFGIGFDTIHPTYKTNPKGLSATPYEVSLFNNFRQNRLYESDVIELSFLEDTLFRVRIKFPEKIVPGTYIAEIYSFDDSQLKGLQSIPIRIEKVGAEAFVHRTAHDMPALYGLVAIIIAGGLGWGSTSLFRRV